MRRPAIAALVVLAACDGRPDRPTTPPPAVPGIATVTAETREVTDVVRAFGMVVGEAERAEVRDARTQLAEAEARAGLAAQQTTRLEALTRGGVAPRKELEAARAEHTTAAAAAARARAALAAFGNTPPANTLAGNETWGIAEVPQDDIASIRRGATATFELDGGTRVVFAGRVETEPAYVSPSTRTAPVRLRLQDPGRTLHPGMTGTFAITGGAPRTAVVIPAEAILQSGDAPVVMVEVAPARFMAQRLEVGAALAGWTEVRAGLDAGARVVTTGAASLLSATRLPQGEPD